MAEDKISLGKSTMDVEKLDFYIVTKRPEIKSQMAER